MTHAYKCLGNEQVCLFSCAKVVASGKVTAERDDWQTVGGVLLRVGSGFGDTREKAVVRLA